MFRTFMIKNSKRSKENRILSKSTTECSTLRPDERTLPYFEIVSEQVLSDDRYLSMTAQQQGAFWRLIIHLLAPERGLVVRHPGMIAKRLGIIEKEWEDLEAVLLSTGLLNVSEDEIYLFQYEYREQYLQTLESNNAKRRN